MVMRFCRTVYVLLAWWLPSHTVTAIFKESRTQQERDQLCANYTAISKAWNEMKPYAGGYPIQAQPWTKGGGKCLKNGFSAEITRPFQSTPGTMQAVLLIADEVCLQKDKALYWNWKYYHINDERTSVKAGTYLSLDAGDLWYQYLYVADETFRTMSPYTDAARIKKYYQPMICSCGQEYTDSGICEDIDECKEVFVCPEYSKCLNTNNGYECHCDTSEGWVNSITQQSLVMPDGTCKRMSVSFSELTVDSTTFKLKINGFPDLKVLATAKRSLYLIDEDGAYNFILENIGSLQTSYVLFNNLIPGTRYKLELKLGESYWSDMIITKCYSRKVGTDDSGIPD